MAVKVAPGSTITETRTTTVAPSSETRRLSDGTPIVSEGQFWDWIESTTPETLSKYDVVISVYRRHMSGRTEALCEQLNYPPDQVHFSRRWVKSFYGGGPYKILVKMEKQLRFNIEIDMEGLPKKPEEIEAAKNPAGNGSGTYAPSSEMGYLVQALRESNQALLAEIRSARGGDLQTEALRNSMALGTQVLGTAVPAVAQIVASAAGGPAGAQNPLIDRLLTAAIEKLMNPPTAPQNALMDRLLNSAVEKLLNPSPDAAGGHETLAQTLVRVAPAILERIDSGMAKMATLRQQELEMMRLRGGAPPTINVAPGVQQPPQQQPNPLPGAPAGGPGAPKPESGEGGTPLQQPPAPSAGMSMQDFIELGIMRIAMNPQLTAEGAAMEMLVLLDAYVPELVTGTANDPNAESELLKMFRERPILQQVPQNPRLTELIQKFLEKARESRTAVDPPEGAAMAPPPAAEPPQPSA